MVLVSGFKVFFFPRSGLQRHFVKTPYVDDLWNPAEGNSSTFYEPLEGYEHWNVITLHHNRIGTADMDLTALVVA